MSPAESQHADVAIVGAGAAGLATAIFAARAKPSLRIALLDGAKRPGTKILVSGGGRCNVTNVRVTPEDFRGGSRNTIRRVLSALPVQRTIDFFREIGVTLHEEEHGKLFPDTNSARTVLEALLAEARRLDIRLCWDHRVTAIEPEARARASSDDAANHDNAAAPGGFTLITNNGPLRAARVVLATGGLSLPKTGSDGAGYTFARQLGHSLVPTVPALAPLVLEGAFHKPLSGVSQEVELSVHITGRRPERLRGSLLWTHFGASGPVVLNASGLWHRARLAGRDVRITASLLPDETFESVERRWIEWGHSRPRVELHTAAAELVPQRVAEAILAELRIRRDIPLAHLSREDRRRLLNVLLGWPLPVRDSRGYNHAEVTAGGVPLSEIDPATMQSRVCPGLYLVGEILDVDGRIGGFNFQWAWASGFVAGNALARQT